ncbi:MAG: hypothetical protein ACFFDN_36835 [Candidatus Hodarchaeota archaeon]
MAAITVPYAFWYGERTRNVHQEVVEWFNSHEESIHSLATEEIGLIGFKTNIKVIDLIGLATPEVLPYRMNNSYKIF